MATVHKQNPILLRFECVPPGHWSVTDKGRACSHFECYKLGYRFSVLAGGEVSKVVQFRTNSLKKLTPENFKSFLLDNANSQGSVLNGWSRTMYAALAASDWFLQLDFQNPNWHLGIGV